MSKLPNYFLGFFVVLTFVSLFGMYGPSVANSDNLAMMRARGAHVASVVKEKTSDIAASLFSLIRPSRNEVAQTQQEIDVTPVVATQSRAPVRLDLGVISDGPFVPPHDSKVIYVDLGEKELTLYDSGKPLETIPVLSIGRSGTPWETPSGTYTVLSKEENHFSTIGNVWMPYSMEFFGNFFIHGWPYYDGGKPVPEGYSGGCIRLSTEDAKKVFEFAKFGTPVVITRSAAATPQAVSGSLTYFTRALLSDKPAVSASAYLVADVETGDILAAHDIDTSYPIASVSKLFTALVSLEAVNQYTPIRVSNAALATYGTTGKLRTGEKITSGDLLFPLLLESSNDAAEVIAEHLGRTRFIQLMNDKAKAIGLSRTSFADPSGLSPENISTARDLYKTAEHINSTKRYIFEVTRESDHTNKSGSTTWRNSNPFVTHRYPEYRGGKQGFTDEAQKTVLGLFDVPVSEFDDRTLVVILLRSNNLEKDVQNLLSFVRKNIYYGEVLATK